MLKKLCNIVTQVTSKLNMFPFNAAYNVSKFSQFLLNNMFNFFSC